MPARTVGIAAAAQGHRAWQIQTSSGPGRASRGAT